MVMRRRSVGRERPGERLATSRSRAGVTALAVLAAGVGAAVGVAAPALATIPGWGFEQVTPADKGAAAVNSFDTFKPTPDGNGLLYSMTLPIGSVETSSAPQYVRYFGSRGATVWDSAALDPPDSPNLASSGRGTHTMGVVGSSWDLSHVLVASAQALAPGAIAGGGNVYMREVRSGRLTLVAASSDPKLVSDFTGPQGAIVVKYVGADGQSALFITTAPVLPGAPPWTFSSPAVLYSWTADRGLRAESVLPASEGGQTVQGSRSGNDDEVGPRNSMARTNGLDHIYFSTTSGGRGAYVRTDGQTRAISVSRIPGAPDVPVAALMVAVGDGGRYALFHTRSYVRLTESTPLREVVGFGTNPLYRYDAENDAIEYIGTIDGSTNVLQMSQDGRTIVFQSSNTLTADADAGRLNMYVWRDGVTKHVASASGTAPRSSAGSAGSFLRVLSENGRYLAFTDNTPSLAQSFGFDNRSAKCPASGQMAEGCDVVYRYDIQEDRLECASCRQDGQAPNGHSGDATGDRGKVRMDSRQRQTVADDGTAFFTSPDDLVPGDANGAEDVYAWKDGTLRLVSRATQGTSARFVDATPDGGTVFFATNDRIVGSDVDRAFDLYMTRRGAGFAYVAPGVVPPCVGGECRGPSVPAPMSWGAGTGVFSGSTPTAPEAEPEKSAKIRVSKIKTVRGTSTKVKVKVFGKGTVRASGSGLRRSQRTVKKAGSYRVSVGLSTRARRTLRRKHQVKVRVTVRFTPAEGKAQRVRISVTFKKPQKHGKASSRVARRGHVLSFDGRKGR